MQYMENYLKKITFEADHVPKYDRAFQYPMDK